MARIKGPTLTIRNVADRAERYQDALEDIVNNPDLSSKTLARIARKALIGSKSWDDGDVLPNSRLPGPPASTEVVWDKVVGR